MLQTFFIPSPSMEPTLMGPLDSQGRDISPAWQRLTGAWNYRATKYRQPKNLGGDKLIASKMLFRLRPPARGDVVVFTPPMEAVLGTSPHFTDPDTLAPINLYMVRVFLEQNPGVLSKDEISALADTALKMHPEIALARGARIESEADLIRLLPVPSQDDYIKRVIAVAGDRVRVVQDVGVFINGELQREAYVEAGVAPSAISFPRTIASPGPRPTLASTADASSPMMMASRREAFRRSFSFWLQSSIDGGWFAYQRQYAERILPNVRKTDQGDEFVVPSGHVFVMGDNRRDGSSYDSRFWGCVPVSSVKARAVATFWPLDRLKLL
jgi:signal peptidase I